MTKVHRRINQLEGYLEQQQQQLTTALGLLQDLTAKSQQSTAAPTVRPLPHRGMSMPALPQQYQPQLVGPSTSGTYYMQAPPHGSQYALSSDSPYASVGGVPVSPTRRHSYKAFTSPQIEIEGFTSSPPDMPSDSHS